MTCGEIKINKIYDSFILANQIVIAGGGIGAGIEAVAGATGWLAGAMGMLDYTGGVFASSRIAFEASGGKLEGPLENMLDNFDSVIGVADLGYSILKKDLFNMAGSYLNLLQKSTESLDTTKSLSGPKPQILAPGGRTQDISDYGY